MLIYLFLIITSLILFYNYYYKRRHLPPGPTPLPILGNILALASENRWETKFIEWSRQYGSVYTYWLGEIPVVAVCDYNDMNKYFVKQANLFVDRYHPGKKMLWVRGGDYGILDNSGELWKEHRRFALKVLRDFGLGKNQMEERIQVELQHLLESVNRTIGAEEIDFSGHLDIGIGSIINAILMGYRFTEDKDKETEFYKLKALTLEIVRTFTSALTHLVFTNSPLINVPILNGTTKEAIDVVGQVFSHLDKQIQRHLNENDYNELEEPNDFIDAYLIERQRRINHGEDEGTFHFDQLRNVLLDFWVAGQETTSSTITWIIAYLIRHPEVQKKLQEELDSVIGSKRIIRNSDKNNLPYTNAVIMEGQRCCNLLSQNLLRVTSEDVEVNGHLLPKGTVVVPQISVALQDPKVFPHPSRFNPSRFMDENGKLKQVEELIPFSIGKRICLGEGMARMELFIFTANLFNQFKFSAGRVAPTLRKPNGASTMTEPYKCKVERRV